MTENTVQQMGYRLTASLEVKEQENNEYRYNYIFGSQVSESMKQKIWL